MKIITVFDTSYSTNNLGDYIIMDSVNEVLDELFPEHYKYHIATHEFFSDVTFNNIKKSDQIFMGGTNIISRKGFRTRGLWKVKFPYWFKLHNVILVGAGWNTHNFTMDIRSNFFWKSVLHSHCLHSVRDSFTEYGMTDAGFPHICNTGCPTLWNISKDENDYRKKKSDKVIFSLTSNTPDPIKDKELVKLLVEKYKTVFFWPQGIGDTSYLNRLIENNLFFSKIIRMNPSLTEYNKILENEEIDYIGTRLHGGIRALQKHQRVIIIGIDNRALEIGKDIHIPVIERNRIESLDKIIDDTIITKIIMDESKIKEWKAQFQ